MVCLVLLAARDASAQAYKVEATLEPQQAVVGDTVIYVLSITHGGQQAPPRPSPPQFDPSWGFTLVPGNFSGTRITLDGRGMAIQTIEHRYPFTVSKEGQFEIPPVQFEVNGQIYKGNPVTLTVTKAPVAAQVPAELQGKVADPVVPGDPQMTRQLAGGIFVLPVLDTESLYEGQQIRLSYHLVIDRDTLRRAGLMEDFRVMGRETPELKQFLKETLYDLQRSLPFEERVIGGKKYVVAPLFEAAITPVKTGELLIEPYKIQLSMRSRQRRSGSRQGGVFDDPFFNDPFLNDPIFSMSPFGNSLQVIAQSAPVTVNVRPVPTQGRPADFAGAVGNFTISARLDKRAAVADEDIVEMTVEIEGQGDAASISAPRFPAVDGLVQLEQPQASTRLRKEGGRPVSTKSFTYKLRPTKAGTLRIPPLTLPTFNPETGEYEVLKTEPQEVQAVASTRRTPVTEASATASAPPALAASNPPQDEPAPAEAPQEFAEDLRYIHTGEMTVVRPGVLTGEGALFYLLLATPPALLLAGWLAGRRQAHMETHRALYRAGRAGAAARRHLRRAAALLRQDDPTPFYEELARALRGFFGDRFQLEPSGLTIEQIEEELRERGASEQALARTRSLLDEADQARYAPVRPTRTVQQRAYDEATQLLNDLEKLR